MLSPKRQLPDERRLLEVDEPAHRELVRRVVLVRVQGVSRRGVIDLEQDEPGLEPDDIEGEHPGRPDAIRGTRHHERVPGRGRLAGGDPDLVSEVARVARPRDVDIDLAELRRASPEVAQVVERLAGRRLEHRPRERPLERDRGDLFRDVLDRHVQAASVEREPALLRIRGGPPELVRGEAMDRAVVDDLAVLVAPGRVVDLPDLELRRIAGDDPVDEPLRLWTGDAVFVERRDVDEGGCLADRVVLDVVGVGVHRRGPVARPLPPLELPVERRGPRMERAAHAHAAAALSQSFGIGRRGSANPSAIARTISEMPMESETIYTQLLRSLPTVSANWMLFA